MGKPTHKEKVPSGRGQEGKPAALELPRREAHQVKVPAFLAPSFHHGLEPAHLARLSVLQRLVPFILLQGLQATHNVPSIRLERSKGFYHCEIAKPWQEICNRHLRFPLL